MCYALAALSDGCARTEVVFLQTAGGEESDELKETVFEFAAAERDAIEERLLETCRAMNNLVKERALTAPRIETCHKCPYFGTACDPRLL